MSSKLLTTSELNYTILRSTKPTYANIQEKDLAMHLRLRGDATLDDGYLM